MARYIKKKSDEIKEEVVNPETGEITTSNEATNQNDENPKNLKNILLDAYSKLDNIELEAIQEEINNLKEEIKKTLTLYEATLKIKDQETLEKIKKENFQNSVRKHYATTKQEVVKYGRIDWNFKVKDLIIIGLLLALIITCFVLIGFLI